MAPATNTRSLPATAASRCPRSTRVPLTTCSLDGQRRRGPGAAQVSSRPSSGERLAPVDTSGLGGFERSASRTQPPEIATEVSKPQPWAAQAVAMAGSGGMSAVALDVFGPDSAHLLQPVDAAAHAWVVNSWCQLEGYSSLIAHLLSDGAITLGLVGWAGVALLALSSRSLHLVQALSTSTAMYFLGGGRISHSDPVLVNALKEAFHRDRPSPHNTFAFPSGHTTAAAFICGVLLFVLLPLALEHTTKQQQQQQGEEAEEEGGLQPGSSPISSAAEQAGQWVLDRRHQLWVAAVALTATGRVLADRHWVSDTMAGACLGAALTAATALLCSGMGSAWVALLPGQLAGDGRKDDGSA